MKKYFIVLMLILIIQARETKNDFSLVIFGDSQTYIGSPGYNAPICPTCLSWGTEEMKQRFVSMANWVANNKDSLKIKFVSHVGDLVDYGGPDEARFGGPDLGQWAHGKYIMGDIIHNSGVAWGISPGNHDGKPEFEHFNINFGVNFFNTIPWFVGNFPVGKTNNSAQVFSVGKNDFLWLHLVWGYGSSDISWAQSMIDSYPSHKVFVTVHSYITQNGFVSSGEYLWDNLINENNNILAVFCGHEQGPHYIQRTNKFGTTVHNFLVNDQFAFDDRHQGVVRWFEINLDSNKLYSLAYNAHNDYDVDESPRTGFDRKFDIPDAFNPKLLLLDSIVPVIRVEIPRSNSNDKFSAYDVKGQLLKKFENREQLKIYQGNLGKVFILQIKEDGKRIVFGHRHIMVN